MASYYSRLQDAIKKNEQELSHLQEELRGLRSVEKDTPIESFNRQYEQILYHMDQGQRRLEENRRLAYNYNSTIDNMRKIKELKELHAKETDFQVRREIDEEISAREQEVRDIMSILTDELAEEAKITSQDVEQKDEQVAKISSNSPKEVEEPDIVEVDATQARLQGELERTTLEYLNAEGTYKARIESLRRIQEEEDRRRQEEGLGFTEEELAAFDAEYMRRKKEEQERIAEAEKRMKAAERAKKRAEKRVTDYSEAKATAAYLGIDVDQYLKIKAISQNTELLKEVYKVKGLGKLSESSKATREEVSKEIVSKIVEKIKNNNGEASNENRIVINIVGPVNIIYGDDVIVNNGDSNVVTIDSSGKKKTLVRRKKPNTANPTDSKTPTDQADPTNPVTEPDEIPRGFNPDGTYRLFGQDIIQDDLSIDESGPKTRPRPPKTGLQTPPGVITTPGPTSGGQLPPHTTKNKPKRGLLTIMDELTNGLRIKRKDGKRYKASNIKVAKGFLSELKSGNFLYNLVHIVPAIIKLPFQLLRKLAGKIMFRSESKINVKKLKARIAKLPEEDLMVIWEEYRGNRVMQERYPSIINTLLEERMQKFALSKVTRLNVELEQRYRKAFGAMKQVEAIDAALRNPRKTAEEKAKLKEHRAAILKGQAENIVAIRNGYKTANLWLSGGAHGFSEDMKVAATGLSLVGKRFAVEHDLDNGMTHRKAQLERAENQAIADGNDEMALRAFVESERLLSENTRIAMSPFGRRSVGKKYYSPLVEQLDYRDNPFTRDLFTTIAVVSTTVGAVQAHQTQMANEALLEQQRAAIARNEEIMRQVNQAGSDIAGKRGTMIEGMEAQGIQDTLTVSNEIERGVLDVTDLEVNSGSFGAADVAGHSFYNSFHESTVAAMEEIASKYASGAITQQQAIEMMSQVSANTQATLGTVTTECLKYLEQHVATHPHIDLSSVQDTMSYLVDNPEAIAEMNKAMAEATAIGDTLAGLQFEQVAALQALPVDVRTQLLAFASTAALATNVASTMSKNARKHKYGNAVTDMVDEYVESQRETSETPSKSPRK